MVSSVQVGKIWRLVRLVLPLKKMKTRTNQGRVGSPKQPAKSRPRASRTSVRDPDGPTESLVAFTRWSARVSSFHQHADRQGFAHRFSVRRLRQPLSWVLKAGPGWWWLGSEVGGRFSDETAHFLRSLASAKVRGMSELLKGRAHAALMRRWCSMLGCAAARSYAWSLLDRVPAGAEGPIPSIHEVMRTTVTSCEGWHL